ncbi:helix-turn-helix transcriptional regulator [Enterobacteriaceae bacterium C23F]
MLGFNSASLRYKFIYLTRNMYHGVAVHSLFAEALQTSSLNQVCDEALSFYMIDKYLHFIPFSLRFDTIYQQHNRPFASDIILPAKRLETKWITFTNILFFVDMFDPERTSFLYLSPDDEIAEIQAKIDVFLRHCTAVVCHDKKMQSSAFTFSLRDQQIVFHMLAGRTIKEIANIMNVSDKLIYKERDQLTRRLESQQEPFLYKRLAQRSKAHPVAS